MRRDNELYLEIQRRLQSEGRLPNETESEGVPLISESSIEGVSQLFGLHQREIPAYFPDYYDEDDEYECETPLSRGMDIASDTLRRFVPSDPSGYLSELAKWMDNSFKSSYESRRPLLKDSAIVGTAFVMKAFELECGPDILEDFNNVPAEEIKKVFGSFRPIEGRVALIDRIAKFSHHEIPSYQVFLHNGIGRMSDKTPYPSAFRDGAALQYSVLGLLWK